MTASNKFGVHIVGYGSATGYGADLKRCADAGQPFGFVKCMLTKGAAGEAKSYSKDTFTMYRASIEDRDFPHTKDGSWTWDTSAECKQSALDWVHACAALWDGERENFDAYELMNEPNPNTEKLPQFLEWSGYCLDEGERLGYVIGWGSFSTGCPKAEQMAIMTPFVGELARRGHVLCMHDGAVVMPYTFQGTATTDTNINSSLRYRWWVRLLAQAGLPIPRIAITECYAYGNKGDPAYYPDWQWYLTELAKDPYLLGVAWYTLGNGDDLYPNIADKPMARVVDRALAIDYAAIAENPTPEQNRTVLSIPYLNQNDPISAGDTRLDCGPACLAMLLASRGLDVTVNDVFRRTKALPGQPITFAQLQAAAASYGYTLEDRRGCTPDDLYALLRDKSAPILLVKALFLNQPGKANPYKGAHYVVLIGATSDGFLVHDPNNLPNTIQPNLAEAWGNCHLDGNPDFAMLVLREDVTPTPAPVPAPIPIPEPEPDPGPLPTVSFKLGVGMGNRAIPTPTEVNAIHTARLDTVKVLTLADPDENRAMIDILRQSLGDIHIMARLFFSVDSENKRKFSPAVFVDYFRDSALALYEKGVREFEVGNEPNLVYEGWGWNWLDGFGFSNFYTQVIGILRGLMPEAKFGFPGLSPGDAIIGVRQECTSFWNEARPAIAASDFVCAHSYWQQPHGYWGMDDITGGMSWRLCPANGKRRVISEFSNNLKSVSPAVKGADYVLYTQILQATGLVDAAYAFALSWPGQDLNREGWITEDGRMTEIPAIVGSRST